MKKWLSCLLICMLVFVLVGCTGKVPVEGGNPAAKTEETGVEIPSVKELTIAQLDELLSVQEMSVVSTSYVVQDEQYKALYPDMLQAIIVNNGTKDVKNALVAFVAWDSNNLPVKIKGNVDFSDGAYIKKVNYGDINLVPGGEFGHNSGFEVDENNNISMFKAVVVSYETFEGETWENPYYDEWEKMYQGVKYNDSLTVKTK